MENSVVAGNSAEVSELHVARLELDPELAQGCFKSAISAHIFHTTTRRNTMMNMKCSKIPAVSNWNGSLNVRAKILLALLRIVIFHSEFMAPFPLYSHDVIRSYNNIFTRPVVVF